MAGPHEIARAHIAVGERADRVGPLLGGNAGGEAMPDIDRDGEGGAERRIVRADHRREVQPLRVVRGDRRADDAAAIADDEGHLLRRAERCGTDQIAFVLSIVVVGDDDEVPACDRFDGLAVTDCTTEWA